MVSKEKLMLYLYSFTEDKKQIRIAKAIADRISSNNPIGKVIMSLLEKAENGDFKLVNNDKMFMTGRKNKNEMVTGLRNWEIGSSISGIPIIKESRNITESNKLYGDARRKKIPFICILEKRGLYSIRWDILTCDCYLKESAKLKLGEIWDRVAIHNKDYMNPKKQSAIKSSSDFGEFLFVERDIIANVLEEVKSIINDSDNYIQ